MKKKKKKREKEQRTILPTQKAEVILGVRVSETERAKIKMYAVRHGVTVAALVRKYINSLPEESE